MIKCDRIIEVKAKKSQLKVLDLQERVSKRDRVKRAVTRQTKSDVVWQRRRG